MSAVDELLAQARRELGHRVGPREAAAVQEAADCWWTSATRSCGSATAPFPAR